MPKLAFYGSSDDNFCYSIDGRDQDEIGCFDKPAIWGIGPKGESPRVLIYGHYSPQAAKTGTWLIGILPVDEDVAIPTFRYSFDPSERGYSAVLTIEITVADFEVTQVFPKPGKDS